MLDASVAADTHHRRAAFRRPRWAACPPLTRWSRGRPMGTPFDEVTQQTLATFHGLFRLSVGDPWGQSDVNQFQRHLGDAGVGLQSPRNQRRLPPERGLGSLDGRPCSLGDPRDGG